MRDLKGLARKLKNLPLIRAKYWCGIGYYWLSKVEKLRCRVRYFTDGAVIGSKGFVNGFYKAMRGELGVERRKVSTAFRHVEQQEDLQEERMYSYRDLQKDVLESR